MSEFDFGSLLPEMERKTMNDPYFKTKEEYAGACELIGLSEKNTKDVLKRVDERDLLLEEYKAAKTAKAFAVSLVKATETEVAVLHGRLNDIVKTLNGLVEK